MVLAVFLGCFVSSSLPMEDLVRVPNPWRNVTVRNSGIILDRVSRWMRSRYPGGKG